MTGSHSSLASVFAASFRDPAGRLCVVDGRIIRIVNRFAVPDLRSFLDSDTARKFLASGHLPHTRILESTEVSSLLEKKRIEVFHAGEDSLVIEHEALPFLNFPCEWSPEMLYAAAQLTLDLAESLLEEGMGLKDATPYNVLFRGSAPVFVDLLSFEHRSLQDPIWLPQAQFERTFLLPLLVNRKFGIPLAQLFVVRRDGLEPEDVYRLCGPLRRLFPPVLTLVSIPTWLAKAHDNESQRIYNARRLASAEKTRFILHSVFKRLRRILKTLKPVGHKNSAWSDYATNNSYSEGDSIAKIKFVEDAIVELNPKRVIDVGCNTGQFSTIAARSGARVVAIDSDPVVVGQAWREASAAHLDILPLVVDMTRPTPSLGWRNAESPAFLNRARGAFDAVLMLAVFHHLLVTERIPMDEIIDLAAELTSDMLIIEFIAPQDSMFRRLTRGRDHLFSGLTPEQFEETCRRQFELIRSMHVEGTYRWLYLWRKKRIATTE
jgi:2-polyprenyl-3-methyl-5-hydroxy-6-metoxy-1,4-benzoquinol methylase